jgi:nucleoid-associated protein YgaU
MREMHAKLRLQPEDADLRQAYDAAARQLGNVQLKIAGETDAAGIYRLQPADTLSALAHRHLLHGDWRVIYESNRYVLDDPDEVIAGLTLVMP